MQIAQDQFDRKFLAQTLLLFKTPIIGTDEVGRGCLAGPVVAAAVFFRPDVKIPKGLTDSKLLSEKQREELFPQITAAHAFGIGIASVEEVDQINILQASFLAMSRALDLLIEKEKTTQGQTDFEVGHLLIDGHMRNPRFSGRQSPVVKGDLRIPMIAAASIVAKVTRDRMMKEFDLEYPQFGFGSHKGYGSAYHREAIATHGPCILHRRTFRGVKEYLTDNRRQTAVKDRDTTAVKDRDTTAVKDRDMLAQRPVGRKTDRAELS